MSVFKLTDLELSTFHDSDWFAYIDDTNLSCPKSRQTLLLWHITSEVPAAITYESALTMKCVSSIFKNPELISEKQKTKLNDIVSKFKVFCDKNFQ